MMTEQTALEVIDFEMKFADPQAKDMLLIAKRSIIVLSQIREILDREEDIYEDEATNYFGKLCDIEEII